ncbi:hypothetical protein [Kribbella qitaiheensis]
MSTDEGDAATAELDQVRGRGPGCGDVVNADVVHHAQAGAFT